MVSIHLKYQCGRPSCERFPPPPPQQNLSAMEQKQVLEALKKIKKELASKYPIKKLGIFGSFARNTQSLQSDIDIVVELGNPKMFDLIGIKQEIEETLHQPIDIVRIRKNMNQYLKQRIEKEAIYV
jgi:uncharacterized protein